MKMNPKPRAAAQLPPSSLRSRPWSSRARLAVGAAAVTGLLGTGALLGAAVARAGTPAPAATPPAPAATPLAPAYDIDNSVKGFSTDAIEKTKVGYQHFFFDKNFAEGRTIKLTVVGPHLASHAPHSHEGHECFFVLEGKAEFFLDGKTRVVGPQTALYCAPQSLHGIKNVGDGELKYLVIKDYPWPPA